MEKNEYDKPEVIRVLVEINQMVKNSTGGATDPSDPCTRQLYDE